MKRATVLALSLGLFTLFTSNLCAQDSGPATHAPDGGFMMRIQSISIPTIPNAPFTATVRTEVVRRLEDGSTIVRKNHRLVARDSSGRVFEERRMLSSDDDSQQSDLTQLEFRNPVSQDRYNCDPQGRTCHVFPYQPPPSALPESVGGKNDLVTRVALGNSMVSGVETVGTRELTVIPARAAASNRPLTITKEFWYSAQLGINIVTKRFDPRSGTQTFVVDDLIVGEPNPSLLEVPAGATILRTTVQQPE
jgi:hypothetical protein